mmetsp:Transcript_34212/g.59849  ORF Transcript_34212/g.59849 Transcript_34212/m.59849 type:complete len:193 (-) Transcript_34212:3544-4122(-)
MSEKLLNEFVLRLNKSKTAIVDARKQCDFLKKENRKLELELRALKEEQGELGQVEEDLKVHYVSAKLQNDEEHAHNKRLHDELLDMRQQKRERQKIKDAAVKEIERLTSELNSIFRKRERLEEQAKEASVKLDRASAERLKAQNACKRNADTFQQMSNDLYLLKGQKEQLNRVVASTFEDDLKTMRSRDSKQ